MLKDNDKKRPSPDNEDAGRCGHGAMCARRHSGVPIGSGRTHSRQSTPNGGSSPVGYFAHGGPTVTRRAGVTELFIPL